MLRMNHTKTIAVVMTALSLSAAAMADASHHQAGHHHDDERFLAGEPGDPLQPARIVLITMNEADGKMMFMPEEVSVKRGEQVKFMLRNSGELDHEFILATMAENLKHVEAMKKNPDMEHDGPNGKRLVPKGTGEILWRFSNAGEFEFSCLIPGHREGGMIGKIVVK
jgi:uncharacterized cupredoxin-like copper-binding protein